jgi:hypothetical protein
MATAIGDDFKVYADKGSATLVVATSDLGMRWLDENIGDESIKVGDRGIVVERRYLLPLLAVIVEDGLSVVSAGGN